MRCRAIRAQPGISTALPSGLVQHARYRPPILFDAPRKTIGSVEPIIDISTKVPLAFPIDIDVPEGRRSRVGEMLFNTHHESKRYHNENHLPKVPVRFMATVAGAFLLFLIAGTTTHAQFQYHYGGTGTDNSKGSVQQTVDSGFISVGESNSGVSDYGIYVVKANANGTINWAFKYDIGGNDYGRGIQQLPDSGFIVTGFTDNSNACTQHDIFLMRLNKNGGVV